MANPEHMEVVKQGAKAIKEWRVENKDIQLDLVEAGLQLANLYRANLQGATLMGANLQATNLWGANLKDATLLGATLWATDLRGADLRGANLNFVTLYKASLQEAKLQGAKCCSTIFVDVDLSETIGLEMVEHLAPSSISVDTLFKSKGKIPKVFLKGAGVPDILIDYLNSLTGKAFEFYSCFISFTENDDIFSKCLYQDLQDNGVRVWRWKEDAKWGEDLIGEVDKAVKRYDKLIVICSKSSLNAPVVLREIERALQKEDDFKRKGITKNVLFPIRLDDYIFKGWEHPRKADVIAKNIGDFREWNNPKEYKKSLARLVRDLRSGETPKIK